MVFRPVPLVSFVSFVSLAGILLTSFSAPLAFSQQPSNAMLDRTKVSAQPGNEAPRPPLSPEMRGDIFMARKMYREAIESFVEGSVKDAVLKNKTGIAYHQLLQLDSARRCY